MPRSRPPGVVCLTPGGRSLTSSGRIKSGRPDQSRASLARAYAPHRVLLQLVFLVFLCSAAAQAQDTQASENNAQGKRSPLEESLVAEALAHHQLELDDHPEGKVVTAIKVHVAQVFDDRDPIPNVFNVFHTRTRDFMVEQEVLQQIGQPWNMGRVLETERNLRNIRQFSLANVVATKGATPDSIILLVVVKDVWSLRLNSSWAYGSAGLDYVLLNPTEENLAGVRASLGGYFLLERDRYAAGASIAYPRLPGTRYSVSMYGGVYKNLDTNKAEGSFGGIDFLLPQYSRYSKWSYGSKMAFRFDVSRTYKNGKLAPVDIQLADGSTETFLWTYHREIISGNYFGLRSFGVEHKFDLEFGLSIDHQRYRPLDSVAVSNSDEALLAFEQEVLPVSDTRLSPYVAVSAYETRFLRNLSIESLGLQEDFRLGYAFVTSLFAAAEPLGSTRNLVGARSSAGYTFAIGTGFLRVGVANRVVVANEGQDEGNVSASGRFVSSIWGVGRLHVDGYFNYRYEDYLNVSPYRLGVNNRLRGYAPNAFSGKNAVLGNVEYRTEGIDILSAQVGLAAFYDLGGVTDELSELILRQAAGAGIRIVFPQAERVALRFDWGFPLSGDVPAFPGAYFFTFGQAFPMPSSSGGGDPFAE